MKGRKTSMEGKEGKQTKAGRQKLKRELEGKEKSRKERHNGGGKRRKEAG